MKETYDIGIVGNWSFRNYGAHLTYYALYSVLSEMGYDVLMIERTMQLSDPNLSPGLFLENPYPEESMCPALPDITAMKMLNEKAADFFF